MYPQNKQVEIKEAIKAKNSRIDKFVERKEANIAYLNSLNSAIAFVGPGAPSEDRFTEVLFYRDKFMDAWRDWYLDSIAAKPLSDEQIENGKQKFQEKMDDGSREIEANAELGLGGYKELDTKDLPF